MVPLHRKTINYKISGENKQKTKTTQKKKKMNHFDLPFNSDSEQAYIESHTQNHNLENTQASRNKQEQEVFWDVCKHHPKFLLPTADWKHLSHYGIQSRKLHKVCCAHIRAEKLMDHQNLLLIWPTSKFLPSQISRVIPNSQPACCLKSLCSPRYKVF